VTFLGTAVAAVVFSESVSWVTGVVDRGSRITTVVLFDRDTAG